ncbi:MAG: flavin reductase family protein [candidate division Zixibacteria bacterium]|nr:flavin reductase family protein [candidate division Zixibacteria bacterium]
MAKKSLMPTTLLTPLPAVLVACGDIDDRPNIITIAWCGIVCSKPPMISVSITEKRYSYELIKKSGEFVVNMTGSNLVKEVDFCGNNSGRDFDKFKTTGLTPEPAQKIKAPLIKESPINLECMVRQTLNLGSHYIFIAEIVATHIDKSILNSDGALDVEKLDPLIYAANARQYWSGLSKVHGFYGYTKGK